MAITSAVDFYKDDFTRTLFPLRTNLYLIEKGHTEIEAFISECLNEGNKDFTFLSQKRVYAAKPNFYLRRTVKLDVVSEYFLYEIVYKIGISFVNHFRRSENITAIDSREEIRSRLRLHTELSKLLLPPTAQAMHSV